MLHGDSIHEVGLDKDGRLERIGQFDYDEVERNLGNEPEPEPGVPMHDAAACLALILQWACKSNSLTNVGARVASLLAYLDPVNAPHDRNTLSAIAEEAGCTKALLSRELLELRDQCGIHLTIGKRSFSRQSCRTAQLAAVEAGVHSGTVRKDRKNKLASEETRIDAIAD